MNVESKRRSNELIHYSNEVIPTHRGIPQAASVLTLSCPGGSQLQAMELRGCGRLVHMKAPGPRLGALLWLDPHQLDWQPARGRGGGLVLRRAVPAVPVFR